MSDRCKNLPSKSLLVGGDDEPSQQERGDQKLHYNEEQEELTLGVADLTLPARARDP
jgi:hypothetical protein